MNALQKVVLVGLLTVVFLSLLNSPHPVSAQSPRALACGETIESVFTANDQRHNYVINAEPNIKLIIYAETRAGNYEDLSFDTGMWAPNGFEIDSLGMWSGNLFDTKTIITDWLSVAGAYSVAIQARTSTGSAYAISLSCVHKDGRVVSANNLVSAIQCGEIVENRFTRDDQRHHYYIFLNRGDRVKLTAISAAGSYESLSFDTGMWAPNGFEINSLEMWSGNLSSFKEIETAELSVTGVYIFAIQGRTATTATYEVSVTCALADGTVVNPGDTPPVNLAAGDTTPSIPAVRARAFSGFGFPGLDPVDFKDVARLPIVGGIPMSGAVTPTGDEILGYQFEATSGDTVELSFNRLSGNLNLGLVVIDSQSKVIYQASLVTAQSMTTRFTVPTTGQYTAGIFRINLLPPSTPEPTAFQLIATVNP